MKLFKNLFLTAIAVFFSVAVFGQGATTSSLSGNVTDENGNPLPAATIVAIHVPSGTQYGTTADNAGNYRIPNMRVGGPYTVTMSFVGFSPVTYTDISLKLGETYVQNVRSSVTYECTHCTFGASLASASFEVVAAPESSLSLSLPTPSISRSITNLRIFLLLVS